MAKMKHDGVELYTRMKQEAWNFEIKKFESVILNNLQVYVP